jgi:hypothetical protein
MRRRFTMLFAGAAMAALILAMAGVAWAADPDPGAQGVASAVRITDVSPEGGSTDVPRDTIIVVDFDSDMKVNTVYPNITLKKKGARKAVPKLSTYTSADDVYTGYPQKRLQPDTVYQVIVDGGRDGVRTKDGGKLGGVDDPNARFKDGNVIWSFRTAES